MERCTHLIRGALIAAGVALGLPSTAQGQQAAASFVRGDANIDGERDVADVLQVLICGFLGTGCASCADAADADDNGARGVSDALYLLRYVFLQGPLPPAPSEACGQDPSADGLDCQSFARCASPDGIPTSRGEILVVPIEHASLALRWDGKTILADPVGSAAQFAGLAAPDLVVITHTHGDHMDATALRRLVTASTVLVIPQAVAQSLAGSGVLDTADERILANGQKTQIGAIEVEAVPMYNLTADRLRYHAKGVGNSYVIDLEGTRVYVSGDTEDIPEMRALQDIAVAFLCMNLPFTMTPAQAAAAALEFRPRVVYPYHYSGQNAATNPATFKALVEAGAADIEVRLRDWYP